MRFKDIREITLWLFGILGGIIVVYTFITRPSVSLEATIEYDESSIPLGLSRWFGESFEKIRLDSLKANVQSAMGTKSDTTQRELISKTMTQSYYYFRSILPPFVPSPYDQIEGFWRVDLANGEDREVESVELYLPLATMAEVSRQGENTAVLGISEVIKIGRMRPAEHVYIKAWTKGLPSEQAAERIRITHKDGIASLQVRTRVGTLGQYMDKYGSNMFWAIGFGVALFWITNRLFSEATKKFANTDIPNDSDATKPTTSGP